MKNDAVRRLLLCLCACLAFPALCALADDSDARVRILVREFAAPAPEPELGQKAAEALRGALVESGLVEPVSAKEPPLPWDRWVTECWLRDVNSTVGGPLLRCPYGLSPAGLRTVLTGGYDTDYTTEGKLLRLEEGKGLTLQVALLDGISGKRLAVAEASGEGEQALGDAAKSICSKLEAQWANDILARRVLCILSQLDEQLITEEQAVALLRDWTKRWPNAPAPMVALFKMAMPRDRPMATREAVELARALRDMVTAGDAGALQLLILTKTDPYAVLADAAAMKGNQAEALALHREAARLLPATAFTHLIDAAQSGIMSRNYPEALDTAREAVALDPENGYANLLVGILLDRVGKRPEAVAHLRDFLAAHPDTGAAGQIQAQIELMAGP